MNLKGICWLALALSAAVTAGALEERISMSATGASGRTIGSWSTEGAVTRSGYKGQNDFAIAPAAYSPSQTADLLLHFDKGHESAGAGDWTVSAGPSFVIDPGRALLGEGAASFAGPASSLSLLPGPGALFATNSRFRDFSIEFWLYPSSAENGEVVLLWQSVRKMAGGVLPQRISCVVAGGRLMWGFANFFSAPGDSRPEQATNDVQLRSRAPLVPRTWSHHLVRFDGDTGLLEYAVDGAVEAIAYTTVSGHEGGTVREPSVGSAAPLRLGVEYAGLVDEFRLSRAFVEKPSLHPYGKASAVLVSPVADLGYGNSRLLAVDAIMRAPGASSVEFAYRIADAWAAWRADAGDWTAFRPGERLPDSAKGRFVQIRVELFPDGTGNLGPSLSSLSLRFEPDPPPPPPARLAATAKDGAAELRWTRVPEADLAGYLVYYGDAPGEYFGLGADQGPSPIDAGNTTTITITGIPNGRLLYFAVAAYDAAAGSAEGGAASRAGEFSPESSARPSRTAR